MPRISRRALAAIIAVATLLPGSAFAADTLKEIRIDWATYNPVSMLLKDKGFLEKEFAKDGIKVVWVKTVSSSNALQFLNANSINFGSTKDTTSRHIRCTPPCYPSSSLRRIEDCADYCANQGKCISC